VIDADAKGVYVIAVTPFQPDGRLDEASTDRMVEFYRGCGADGLTILGIMGEAPKLDLEEAVAFSRQVVKRSGAMPIIVGVSAPGFAAMRSLTHQVMEAGAAGVMIAPPASVRTDDQIVAYYSQAVAAIGTDVPFVLQDYPQANGVVMAPSVIARILAAHASCAMLKHEEWPGLDKLTAVRALMQQRARRVPILVGNGALFLDFEMERGADGAMTGYSFPEMLVDVVRVQQQGARDAAHDLFDAHLPLLRYEQQTGGIGLAVRKHILQQRGAIRHDAQRAPGSVLSPLARAEVRYLIDRLARHDPRARIFG
jgi:4-hydroxy-tetrahydrodipicolinate synthase